MADNYILRTYGDVSMKDDVLGLIEILTATEDSIQNAIGTTSASGTVHETLTDTLATVGSLAVYEGAELSNAALTTPSRLTNIVQEVAKRYSVTDIQRAVDKFQAEDELSRQRAKAMKEWRNSVEYDLIRSTLTSGVSGTAPKMSGIIEACSKSTNHTSHNSGTAWSASILKGLMKANWDNSNGDVATDLYMGSFLKNVTDDFTNKSTTVVNGNETTIVNSIDVFETGLGKVRIHTNRYVFISGTDSTGRVLAIRPEKLKVAYLIRPRILPLSTQGAFAAEAVHGAMTLEVKNQDSNWYADGFLIS
jgi:hypothetical protein